MYRVIRHVRTYGISHTPLYILASLIFFWAIFDSLIAYVLPLLLVENGMSKTMLGIIIGTSSIAGAGFDFLLGKFLHNAHYRRLYFLFFIVCFSYPLLLWHASQTWMFVIAMAAWGLYYDLANFSNYDFVSREMQPHEFASSFGLLDALKCLGFIVGPIIAGLIIGTAITSLPFVIAGVFLTVAGIFFSTLLLKTKPAKPVSQHKKVALTFLLEISLWKRIGKTLLPFLIFTSLINIFDAFFWTIGPLFSESLKNLHPFGGLLMSIYFLPSVLVGFLLEKITRKHSKKHIAFGAFALGSLLLTGVFFFQHPLLIVLIIFITSCFNAVAWPVTRSIFADDIFSDRQEESEIETLADFSANFGYIIGPMVAGVLADTFGNASTFGILGLSGCILSLLLLFISTRKKNLVFLRKVRGL